MRELGRSRSRSPRHPERRRSRSRERARGDRVERDRERDERRRGRREEVEDLGRRGRREEMEDQGRRGRSRSPGGRRRSRSPRRRRSRSNEEEEEEVLIMGTSYIDPNARLIHPPRKPRTKKPAKQAKQKITEIIVDNRTDEEIDMMKLMGFSGFDSTKGKHVPGTDASAVNIVQKRKYRQYMNRRGGFNRPLDFCM